MEPLELSEGDRKSPGRGRPADREIAAHVQSMQSVLSRWNRGLVPSSVSGRHLTLIGVGYMAWYIDTVERKRPTKWTPPPLASRNELEERRARAVEVVRSRLLQRAHEHANRARRGALVLGLRMTSDSYGPHIVPSTASDASSSGALSSRGRSSSVIVRCYPRAPGAVEPGRPCAVISDVVHRDAGLADAGERVGARHSARQCPTARVHVRVRGAGVLLGSVELPRSAMQAPPRARSCAAAPLRQP